MANSLTTQTMLTERAEIDRGRMIASIEHVSAQIASLSPDIARQSVITDDHIRSCEALNASKERIDEQRHAANQRRLARLERIYYVGAACVLLLGFLTSDFGQRLYHHVFPAPPILWTVP